jgi:hypothetical protein
VAADPAEQSGVVDDGPRRLVEPEPLGEAQRDHGLAHDVLHRLAHPEVRPERDHRDDLREADPGAGRWRGHGAVQ